MQVKYFEIILGQAKRLRRLPHLVLHFFFENIPHEEVFRECTIFGIFFDSWIAKQDKLIDMRSCLSIASSSNDYENRTFGLRAQDVFALFLFASVFFLVTERKWRTVKKKLISFDVWQSRTTVSEIVVPLHSERETPFSSAQITKN